jgi:hypothetical protein
MRSPGLAWKTRCIAGTLLTLEFVDRSIEQGKGIDKGNALMSVLDHDKHHPSEREGAPSFIHIAWRVGQGWIDMKRPMPPPQTTVSAIGTH